jgi:hypothetical protein
MGYITDDLRWTSERIAKLFHELSLKPHVLRDAVTNIVFIPGWWTHNQPENPKVAIYLTRLLLALPDCPIKAKAVDGLKASGYRSEAVLKEIGDWVYDPKQETLPFVASHGQGELIPAPTALPKEKKKSEPGTRLEEDWQPPSAFREYGISKGLSESDIDAIVIKYVRYWTGPDAKEPVKKDWYRTWCNWIDDEAIRRPKKNGNGAHAGNNGHDVQQPSSWEVRMGLYNKGGAWSSMWGPEPGQPGCKVPQALLPPE